MTSTRTRFLVIAAAFLTTACSGAEAEPHHTCRSIGDAVEQRLRTTHAPAASVAIVRHGKIVFERGFGTRSEGGLPVDAETRFEIGSTTKQFTAAAILQLRHQGRLSLNDKISRFIPGFPHASELTIIELLHQTSGLVNFPTAGVFIPLTQEGPGGIEAIKRLANAPLLFRPGSHWEYSNLNYIILGRIVEIASGETYASYLKRNIFGPAGMSHSTTVAEETRISNMATGYWHGDKDSGLMTKAPVFPDTWFTAAGNVISTAGDVARWDIALESGRIVDHADVALMKTPVRLSDGSIGDYGFHWWTSNQKGHLELSGLGDTWGFSSANDLFPQDDLAIIVLESIARNSDGSSDAAEGVALAAFNCIVTD